MSQLLEMKNSRGKVEFFNIALINVIRLDKLAHEVYIYLSNGDCFIARKSDADQLWSVALRFASLRDSPWMAVKDNILINLKKIEAISTADHALGKVINFRMDGGQVTAAFFENEDSAELAMSSIRRAFNINNQGGMFSHDNN